jgi:hypothetical protein
LLCLKAKWLTVYGVECRLQSLVWNLEFLFPQSFLSVVFDIRPRGGPGREPCATVLHLGADVLEDMFRKEFVFNITN